MSDQYAYLIGALGLAIVFGLFCFVRKDLRKAMIYSGLLYLSYGFLMFMAIKLFANTPGKTITPGYWTPPSLFKLNGKTGGYGVEDALFSFFAGAIAAAMFELLFRTKISKKPDRSLKKGHLLLFAMIAGALFIAVVPVNAIYFFIFLQLFGALVISWQRRDLIEHVFLGGISFMVLYALLFQIFKLLFPAFLGSYYHLQRTSHRWIFGIPLEEYLYALTLGMMWAPLYEYQFRLRDSKMKSSKSRRLSPALAAPKK